MGIVKAVIIITLLGGVYSAPPLFDAVPEFETFEEIVPLSRLPRSVIPTIYKVEIQPILDEGYGTRFTAPGKVWINVICQVPTNNVTLHALTLNISDASVKISEFLTGSQVAISSFDRDVEKEFYIINLQNGLQPGNMYQIYIEYVAPVSKEVMIGLYLSNYTESDGSTRYLATTDLEATDCRRWIPTFDEPQMKAQFDVSIIRLPKYHSLSNTNLLRTEMNEPDIPTGWVRDVFDRTEKMSTYLLCIAVSEFEMEEASPGLYSKPVKVWGPPPYMRAGAGKYSPDLTAKLMTALENYYRLPYTFPKMDKIAVPHFLSGAMENWGLNTYRLNRLLIEEGVATAADRISTAITLSHELVHQWFGNLITLDLWINEGFASYYSNTVMMDVGLEDMLPLDTLVSDAVQRAMYYDVTDATHPVHHAVETPSEIRIMFDTITYSKGCAVVRMTEAILTESVMRDALTGFLTKFKYANTHQDDLFQVYDDIVATVPGLIPVGLTMKEILDTWTLQTGFPILKASRTPGSPSVLFEQAKFKPDISLPDDPVAVTWHIPISLHLPSSGQVDRAPKLWLAQNEPVKFHTIGGAAWFIANPQQTGYYRVQYDTNSLQNIIQQLHTDHTVFDPQTRSALVDDSLNLAFAGYSSLEQALNLTMYLKNERHLTPWTSFVTNMAKPYRFLARSAGLSAFRTYVLGLVKNTLTEINLDPQPSEPIGNATILRNKLFEWACNLGDWECVQYSKQKFASWMDNPSNLSTIFPDLRPFVYCTAVGNGGDAEWEFALAQYHVANREVTRANLIRSLGCSKSSNRLSRLLDLSINVNSGIENSHRVMAMQAAAGNSIGTDLVFNFVRNNFEAIRRRFGLGTVTSVITTLSNTLNKAYDVTDLERFIKDNEAVLLPVNGSLQTSISNIQNNIRWTERNLGHFRNFVAAV